MFTVLIVRAFALIAYADNPAPWLEPKPIVHSLGKGCIKGKQPWSSESLAPKEMPAIVPKGNL